MKGNLLMAAVLLLMAAGLKTTAQTLYGTTTRGGIDRAGSINKFMPGTNNLTVVHSLKSVDKSPYGELLQASDGKFYGMAGGGSNGLGVIFSFDPSSSTYTTLKHFNGADGSFPYGSLIQASDGKLYGMTVRGGSGDFGVIFSFDPSSSTYTKLKDFNYTDGAYPTESLMQASNGKLYGVAGGGSNGFGVVFSFDPLSSIYTKLEDFDGTNGATPSGNLVQASDGKLYGVASNNGINGFGVIFSIDPSTAAFTKLKEFGGTVSYPIGGLLQASDGKLYGVARGGTNGLLGAIYSFDISTVTYTNLHDFDDPYIQEAAGSLVQANNGKLYGMLVGTCCGIIFSFDPSASSYTKLRDFDNAGGIIPKGGFMQASDGKLYGMTSAGGSTGAGVIFSFDPPASSYTKLYDFGPDKNGTNISGTLVQAGNGKLYGVTTSGGTSNAGIIFSFDPLSSTYTKLKDFDGTGSINGSSPTGGLMLAGDGKLYGVAAGGSNGLGVIFSFDPSTSTYTKLYDFGETNSPDPVGSLMQATDGKLYGISSWIGANRGGTIHMGTIFSFDPSTSTYTKLHNFSGANGALPVAGLVQAKDGKLYGITESSIFDNIPIGNGTIFSYDLSSSTFTKVWDFGDNNGFPSVGRPLGRLLQATDGKLYGTKSLGGTNNAGSIFSFDPTSSILTNLKDFNITDGANPSAGLMQASDGKLYGTTANGGSSNLGVIFSYDISSSTYTKLQDYTGSNGANPSSEFIEVKESGNGGYCSAKGVCSDKGFIKNVYACYSFNNTTCCTGYGDYTAKGVNTAPGKLLGFSVTPGYNSSTNHPLIYIRVWIDWNGDGDFTDGGELVYAPFYPVNVKAKFWIRVPAGTGTGRKRMRVVVSADYKMSPCSTIANGEVEDYSINIRAARFAVPDAGPDAFDEAGETFTIYPNPVKHKMIIERSGYDEGRANNAPALMVVTNANGKTLIQSRLVNLVQAVDVSRLPSGVYFVTIINGNNKTTNKMIINR